MAREHEGKETVSDQDFVFGGDAADIPPGTYAATLSNLGTKSSDQYGEFRTWDFTLDNGSEVGGASSMNTGPKSKGGRWGRALLGRQPEKGEKVTLVGRKCLVVVGLNGDDWPTVTDVLPPMAATAPQTPHNAPQTRAGMDAPLAPTLPTRVIPDTVTTPGTALPNMQPPIGSIAADDEQLPF